MNPIVVDFSAKLHTLHTALEPPSLLGRRHSNSHICVFKKMCVYSLKTQRHMRRTTVVQGKACVAPYPHATEFTTHHIRKNGPAHHNTTFAS